MSDTSATINYYREAFLHPVNIGFLFTVSVLAMFFSGTEWMPALIFTFGLGVELLYLGNVPTHPWFRRYIQKNVFTDEIPSEKEVKQFELLAIDQQKRFLALQKYIDRVKKNFSELPVSYHSLTSHLIERVRCLMSDYLKHLVIQQQYEEYLMNATPDSLEIEIRALKKEMASVRSDRLLEVKRRRLDILQKRLEKQKNAEERALICISQQQTIEDAIEYIYEKSLTMGYPHELDYHLDQLIVELDETAEIIKDIEDNLPPTYTILKNMENRRDLNTVDKQV